MTGNAPRRAAARRRWPAIAAATAGLLLYFYPLVFSFGTRLPGGQSDPRHLRWILEWNYRCLSGDPICERWTSPPFFHPAPAMLGSSEILLGQAAFYVPLRFIGLGPELSQAATVALLLLLAFASAHWLLRRVLGFSELASTAGSFLFAFGAPRTAQLDRSVQADCAAFFSSFGDTSRHPSVYQLDAMWAVFELDKPTLNGWSSYTPEGWVPLFESADRSAKGLSRIRETIESWSKSHGLAPGSVCWVMPDDEQPGSVRLQRLPAP